jgi:hypothetical protein
MDYNLIKKNTMRIPKFMYLIQAICLFGIEFQVTLYAGLTLRKLVLLYLIIVWIKDNVNKYKGFQNFNRDKLLFTSLFGMLFIYVSILYLINTPYIPATTTVFSPIQIIQYVLYIIVFPVLLTNIFGSIWRFLYIQIIVILLQAVIAVIGKFNNSFALFIWKNFYGDYQLYDSVRIGTRTVMINIGGAQGSIVLLLGCFCCLTLLITKKYNPDKINTLVLIGAYGVLMLAMTFVARTGLYIAAILLTGYLYYTLFKQNRVFILLLYLIVIAGGAFSIYLIITPDSYLKKRYIQWIGEIILNFNGEGSAINEISNMEIPSFSWETFWGTSVIRGLTSSGINIQHDSGYIMYYSAIGIIGSLFFYSSIAFFFIKEALKIHIRTFQKLILLFLLIIYIIEAKEPFMGKTPSLMVLSTISMLACKLN